MASSLKGHFINCNKNSTKTKWRCMTKKNPKEHNTLTYLRLGNAPDTIKVFSSNGGNTDTKKKRL